MNTKHTPGPWQILDPSGDPFESNTRKVIASGKHGGLICDASVHWYDPVTARANARLIAAAPDLLAALELALEQIGQFTGWGKVTDPDAEAALADGRAALAKAKGE